MGKITGVAHIAVTVKDMKQSLDFYTRVLGFKQSFAIPDPQNGEPWIEYLYVGGGQFIELFYGGSADNPWNDSLRGFNHLCLQVDDIQSVVDRLKTEGAVFIEELKQGADKNWQAWIIDPDGIRIELMQIDPESQQAQVAREFA